MSHGWQFGDDTAQNELVEPGMKFLSYSIMEPVYLVGKPIIGMAIFGTSTSGLTPPGLARRPIIRESRSQGLTEPGWSANGVIAFLSRLRGLL